MIDSAAYRSTLTCDHCGRQFDTAADADHHRQAAHFDLQGVGR
mgnify:CR=1 FL=1